ncbi:MAG: acyl-CoA dehydrogenase [Gammaproteobacteria bacterium]|nr:acyl-CoA dehydrogenase [Gammaproteobacteria bacterium]
MSALFWTLAFLGALGAMAYHRATLLHWTLAGATLLLAKTFFGTTPWLLWVLYLAIFVPLNLKGLRQKYLTAPALAMFRKVSPKMSDTEKVALDAGTVWWEGELFRGKPNWSDLHHIPAPKLSAEEKAFIDGPVEELCAMVNDWKICHDDADLPPEVWDFIKKNRFFAMIIPRSYGGLEFSAYAHSQVLIKLNSVSPVLGSTVSVPNSLGPAELLLHYGTEAQKSHYLPRLARGEEVPCFALTSPEAGSDAGAIPDVGIVCKGEWEGREIIGMRLTWDKRYITLAPVASVLGLAFKLQDPEHLLGDKDDYGITCALIPVATPGVEIGRRHFPLNIPFQNGPTRGQDVFVPLDYIIGGQAMAGQGWRMLVECLSAGRAISLPSGGTAAVKVAAIATGAYARIRKQFKMPIGKMEGVEEALTRIAGHAYQADAVRSFTVGAVDLGEKPSVPSAIVKYHVTEMGRQCMIDAMDVHGGKAVILGPKNYIGRGYQGAPISITVEGANILTRSMIIYGQGAIRCHPYVLEEMRAGMETDEARALDQFDAALFGHVGFVISNLVRSFWLGLSGARLTRKPFADSTGAYYQQLTRLSSNLALLSDLAMAVLGGELKRREKISARLGDILSMLFIGSSVLKRYEDEGRQTADLPVVHWAMQDCLIRAQDAIVGILDNFPNRAIGIALKAVLFPLGKPYRKPSDRLGHRVAKLLLEPNETRSRIGAGIYLKPTQYNQIGQMEEILKDILKAEELAKKARDGLGKSAGGTWPALAQAGLAAGVLSAEEAELLERAEAGRKHVISVDDFAPEDLRRITAAVHAVASTGRAAA